MNVAPFSLLLLVGFGLGALIVTSIRAGRPGARLTVPTTLAGPADRMRARARDRTAVAAGAVLLVFATTLVATLEALDGLPAWTAACLAGAGSGCLAVTLIAPPRLAATSVRSAELTPRTAHGFGPSWAFRVPTVLAALLAAALVVAATFADHQDGTDVLAWSAGTASGWVDPYPGWRTALPLLALLGVGSALFAGALRRVAGWPRPPEPGLYPLDDDIRRATTRMLLLGATGALLAALGSFGAAVAETWSVALFNERVALADQAGKVVLPGPTSAETLWGVTQVGGLALLFAGLVVMAGAALAGHVRAPALVPATDPAAERDADPRVDPGTSPRPPRCAGESESGETESGETEPGHSEAAP